MIDIENLRSRSVISSLYTYEGTNPYILKFKEELEKKSKISLTPNQTRYILDNFNKIPIKVDRLVRITPYLGEELKRTNDITFVPEKILIEYILADNDKTFHIYGKLKKNQEVSKMYFLPKTQLLDDPYYEDINIDINVTKYNDILHKSGKKLFKHQEEAIKFLLSRDSCILALGMGLGKSMASIIAALETGAKKILVVCPSSLKINWEREINMFCDETCIVTGKKWNESKFTIINFDILKNFHTLVDEKSKEKPLDIIRDIVNAKFDLVIIDEAHSLKNNDSIRGKIMVDICVKHGISKAWLLTGTPIANRPMDFFNLLSIIKSPIADNWHYYAVRYCDGKRFFKTLKSGRKKQIWLTDGASNLDELANKTKNIMLVRRKEDVLDMPEKTIIPIYHQLSQSGWVKYNNLWEEYLEKRKQEKKHCNLERDLVELILLRKHIAMEAIPNTLEIVENAVEQGQKVIVFTNFTDELLEIYSKFKDIAVIHHGPMNNVDKQKSVDRFQTDDKIKVFVGNIKSAGVGITLTASNTVVFNSFDWVPGQNEQCEDRSYRIGQKNCVSVYYQLFEETISTRIWETLNHKKDIISQIMRLDNDKEDDIIDNLIEINI